MPVRLEQRARERTCAPLLEDEHLHIGLSDAQRREVADFPQYLMNQPATGVLPHTRRYLSGARPHDEGALDAA